MGKIKGFRSHPLYRGGKFIPARVEEPKLVLSHSKNFLFLVPLRLRGDEAFQSYLWRDWEEILSQSLHKIVRVLAKRYGEDALARYYRARFEGRDVKVPPRLAHILDGFPPSLVEEETRRFREAWKPPRPSVDWDSFPHFGDWEELEEWCTRNGCTYQVVGLGATHCCAQEYQIEVYDVETGEPVSTSLINFTYHPRDCCCCLCGCRGGDGCDCDED